MWKVIKGNKIVSFLRMMSKVMFGKKGLFCGSVTLA